MGITASQSLWAPCDTCLPVPDKLSWVQLHLRLGKSVSHRVPSTSGDFLQVLPTEHPLCNITAKTAFSNRKPSLFCSPAESLYGNLEVKSPPNINHYVPMIWLLTFTCQEKYSGVHRPSTASWHFIPFTNDISVSLLYMQPSLTACRYTGKWSNES